MNGKNKKKKQEKNRGNLELLVLLSCPDAVGERHIMLTARSIKFLDYLAFADSVQKKESLYLFPLISCMAASRPQSRDACSRKSL